MSAFSDLEKDALETSMELFGDMLTLIPMKQGPDGVNGVRVEDDARGRFDTTGIRAEFPAHVSTSDNGVGRGAVLFGTGIATVRQLITLRTDLPWVPKQFDRLFWHDRPQAEYRIAEPMPDGGAGISFVVNRL